MNYPTPNIAGSPDQQKGIALLAVGSPDEWARKGHAQPRTGQMAFVSFHDVTAELLEHLRPTMIVSPVLAKGFDCIDLAQLLHSLKYSGAYKATAQNLPNPKLIEAEITQLCPRLDFEVLTSV